MRSTTEQATTYAGFGSTRQNAQNVSPCYKTQALRPKSEIAFDKSLSDGQNCPFELRCDWLRVKIPIDCRQTIQDLVDWLMGHFTDTLAWQERPRMDKHTYWENWGASTSGITVHYNTPLEERGIKGEAMIDIPGGAIDRVHQNRFLWVCRQLKLEYSARCLRFDFGLHDWHKQLNLDLLDEAADNGNYLRFHYTYQPKVKRRGKRDGHTVMFGSRQSAICIRGYDNELATKGKEKGNKFEAEYKREVAEEFFNKLVETYETAKHHRNAAELTYAMFCPKLFDNSFGLVLVDRKRDDSGDRDNRNASRCDVLNWWQEFTDKVIRYFVTDGLEVQLKRKRIRPSIGRTADHAQKNWANGYSAMCYMFGKENTHNLLYKDFSTLPRQWKAIVSETQKVMEKESQTPMDFIMQLMQLARQSGLEECDGN